MNNQRTTTRSQSEADPNLLAAPLTSFRRRRSPTRDQRLASPNHCEEEEGLIFTFPEAENMGDPNNSVQALTEALQGVRVSSRKPELPAFDPKNVDIWLKRIDNAYRRAGVTEPKDKFAFIETKFSVDADPRINEFLYGEGIADEWTAFEAYLRSRYGRTKAQQAAVILDGFQRDGKLPSEMFAAIKEKIGSITVDDIVKEMVLRELPTDVRRTIHDKVKDADGAETVKLADQYFDRNGKPIHQAPSLQVSAINDVPDPIDTDGEDEVNAINHRFPKGNRWTRPRQGQKPMKTIKTEAPKSAPKVVKANPNYPVKKSVDLCQAHFRFGDKARYCEVSCSRFDEQRFPGNGQAGQK